MVDIISSALGQALFSSVVIAKRDEYRRLDPPIHRRQPEIRAAVWVLCVGQCGPDQQPEALAYLARTVGGNEGGNGANIATLIDGLVSDGVWAKLDALYVLAQQNQTDARLNLIGTSYSLTSGLFNDPSPRALTFTAYVGFSGFVNGLDSGFNPTTAVKPSVYAQFSELGLLGLLQYR